MVEFTSDFWNFYIIVLTVLGVFGCGLLLYMQSTHEVKATDNPNAPVGTTGHIWDEDLSELNTPMPRWWMWLFYITIFFSIGYLFLYPGLGTYAGKLGWESTGQYKEELGKAEKEYGPLFAKYQKQDLKAVAADPQARAIGERLFLTYCAQCHGSDARGNKGFPNLTDKDWLHGGEPETIKTTIMNGRTGMMPPMGAVLGSDKDVENVAHYVLSLSGSTSDPIKTSFGKEKFGACMACHSAGGVGNPALGAPNLSDKIWLYGGSVETVMETIRKGRTNTMPAFGEFLGEGKVHLLSAYVWSLSNNPETK
ncbi:cytochrome-c oxidase, cbb3-type subunit III [Massilia sp. MB5]|uniref:cytochrome-c oxidase, cbb3-type subunit III n=1 Tax=unclassified Massilia TaxID=2609279 RepID=UPI00067E61FE|nr:MULTISPECIES: cytochrome-c oxidase, cbb3-type subunit III [unclassified Massilia]AKU23292.1 cytochrome C oxidase Cbb3 [Massilia sp. NR 4-1]UMR31788.1 cytochrome-c oxidase, cbb3-type subunit III [Massilia sp. MB5]